MLVRYPFENKETSELFLDFLDPFSDFGSEDLMIQNRNPMEIENAPSEIDPPTSEIENLFLDFIDIVSNKFSQSTFRKKRRVDHETLETSFGTSFIAKRVRSPRTLEPLMKNQLVKIQKINKQKECGKMPLSQYSGVVWDRRIRKWRAQLKHQYLGLYRTDREAAQVVNFGCMNRGFEILNPGIGTKRPTYRQMKKRIKPSKQSPYRGVRWDEKNQIWHAQVTYQGVRFNIGKFEDDLEAAHGVNRMCDELKIKRRNKDIGIGYIIKANQCRNSMSE